MVQTPVPRQSPVWSDKPGYPTPTTATASDSSTPSVPSMVRYPKLVSVYSDVTTNIDTTIARGRFLKKGKRFCKIFLVSEQFLIQQELKYDWPHNAVASCSSNSRTSANSFQQLSSTIFSGDAFANCLSKLKLIL